MATFPFRIFVSNTHGKNRAKSFFGTALSRVLHDKYIGVCDEHFCQQKNLSSLIEQLDSLMDKGHILKKDTTTYLSHIRWNGMDIVVKRYNHRNLVYSIRHTVKGSRARRCWHCANRLTTLGIATPRPFGYLEHCKMGLLWQSYLLTQYVESKRLKDALHDDKTTQATRERLAHQAKELLDKLGKYGITHGDLKDKNILVTETGLVLTDLDGMKAHKCPLTFRIYRDKDTTRIAHIFEREYENPS